MADYVTAIITAAMEMLGGGGGVSAQCRTPQIMADAAYIMLTRDSRSFTGNFVIGRCIFIVIRQTVCLYKLYYISNN